MVACGFVIPGDIDLPTGGYGYDRRVLALLPGHGIDVDHVPLTGGYPAPTSRDLDLAVATLDRLSAQTVLLIDGLALGAMPEATVARIRQPIVALCHHPLALEAGLAPSRMKDLKASETAALRRAAAVVTTSTVTKALLVDDFAVSADKVIVAEPGTDPAARATGSGEQTWALLAVGSVVPRKGYDVLIRALASLGERNWRLIIAGADDRVPETTAMVHDLIRSTGLAEQCRLIGPVGPAELDQLYARADLFVMPSLFEGYGMVLGEAMARGLPIVCTTGGAAAETAPDAAAVKVAPGDAAAFSAALARVMGNRDLWRRMGDASWGAGQALPRWEGTAGIIADVIRKVAT